MMTSGKYLREGFAASAAMGTKAIMAKAVTNPNRTRWRINMLPFSYDP
jgi:hypothetical protein